MDACGASLADGRALQMSSQPPTVGEAAALEGLAASWRSFRATEHDLDTIHGGDRRSALEALNHCTRLDGGAVTLRAMAFTDRDDAGRVASVRLYADIGPLFPTGG